MNARGSCRLLALDLSTHVGWAFYQHADTVPTLGTWHAPRFDDPDNLGPIFAAFEDWLCARLHEFKPALLAFEAPILPTLRTFQKTRAIRLSYGFSEITERIAYQRGVRCLECHPSTVKLRLTGRGTAKKRHMVAAAERLGFIVETDHEADAIGVALVAYDHVDPRQHELLPW